MSVARRCTRVIRQTGSWLRVLGGEGTASVMAVGQPMFSTRSDVSGSAGFGTARQYCFYICAEETAKGITQGDWLVWQGSNHKVVRTEPIMLGESVLYYKAVTQLMGEEGEG